MYVDVENLVIGGQVVECGNNLFVEMGEEIVVFDVFWVVGIVFFWVDEDVIDIG